MIFAYTKEGKPLFDYEEAREYIKQEKRRRHNQKLNWSLFWLAFLIIYILIFK